MADPGAPTKLTKAVIDKMCEALKIGSSIEAAAAYANVSKFSVYKWMKRGRKDKEDKKKNLHTELIDAIEKAFDFSEIYHLNKIDQLSKDNWNCSRWILERRFPKTYGPKAVVKIEDNDTKDGSFKDRNFNEIIAKALDDLEDDQFDG